MTAPPAAGPLALVDPPMAARSDPYRVYLDGLPSAESERAMRRCLDELVRLLLPRLPGPPESTEGLTGVNRAWWLMTYQDTAAARAALIQREPEFPPSTVNQHLSALRRILKECWRLAYMDGDAYNRAIEIRNVKGTRVPPSRMIRGDEAAKMIDACLADVERGGKLALIGLRDACLVALLYAGGFRRGEVAGALVQGYDAVGRSLRVIGKGDKERAVPVALTAAYWADRWLVAYGVRSGPLLPRLDRYGNIRDGHLGVSSINYIVDKRREQAGLPPVAPHDFRRTMLSNALSAGADLSQAQRIAGHSSPGTTALYDIRPAAELLAVADRLPALPMPEEAQ